MSIAVVIPAFVRDAQGVGWLHEAVASAITQSWGVPEIVVCDDASPVPVPPMRGITLLRHERQLGPGAARNTAIRAARAEWILPLDADDILPADALKILHDGRCENAYTYGDLEFFGSRTGTFEPGEFSFQSLSRMAGTNPVTSLFHRSAWSKVSGYDESLEGLEDVEFSIRLAASGICGRYVRGKTLEYRRHAESRHAQLEVGNRERLIAVRQKIQQKHWRAFQTMADCDRCPGSSGSGGNIMSNKPNSQSGGVPIQYVGPRYGSFTLEPAPSDKRYLVDGKGFWFNVDPQDVNFILGHTFAGAPEYRLNEPVQPQVNATFNQPMPPGDLTPIKALDEAGAIAAINGLTDVIDLRVYLSQERAGGQPREAVVKAIIDRGAALVEGLAAPPPAPVRPPQDDAPDISKLDEEEALALIQAADSAATLGLWQQQERAAAEPRQSILKALADKGVALAGAFKSAAVVSVAADADIPNISTMSAKEAAILIAQVTSVDNLQLWLTQEQARPDVRKTVTDALTKRIKELTGA